MKTVDVLTYDSKIFQAVMTIVVKNQDGNYAVLLKDLCNMIQLDVKSVNEFMTINYTGLQADSIPHLELSKVVDSDEWYYIQGGKKREITAEDVYVVSKERSAALPYALLDLLRAQTIATNYDEKFAVILSMTLSDCLEYAPEFEC